MRRQLALICLLLVAAAGLAGAAPPTVPTSLPYQGLLLDGLGQPRTGNVDLVVRVYDAVFGGTLVYKQSFPTVALADGVFTVQLGPTGEGTDAPSNPLTTDLATALAGDAGITAPVRFLEVTVGTDGPLTRTQVLSSAYALRASSAATADTAASAVTATTATNATQVGGLPSAFVTELYEHFDADGGAPPNTDPREGLGDADGDGTANFIDADNDADGAPDATEMTDGTDINLVTPRVTAILPTRIFHTDSAPIEVTGTGFQGGLTAVLGGQTLVPANLTFTGFGAAAGPQAAGSAALQVTNTNGQTTTLPAAVEFTSAFTHTIGFSSAEPTLAAKPGATQVALSGQQEYGTGTAAEGEFALASANFGQLGVTWTPSGALAGIRCRAAGASCVVEIQVDGDGDRNLADEAGIGIETISDGFPSILSGDLALDPAGHWVGAYVRRGVNTQSVVAHDHNGDGDFVDANELVNLEFFVSAGGSTHRADLALDSAGRVAYLYRNDNTNQLRYAWDRNGDGDFADTISGNPEKATLVSGATGCFGAAFDGSDRLIVVHNGSDLPTLARDLNLDGDFADAGESVVVGAAAAVCDVARVAGQPLSVMHDGGGLKLLVDKSGDGDFDDAGESTSFGASPGATPAYLALNGGNRAVIALGNQLVIGTTD